MTKHFRREIDRLKKQLLALSAQVEENLHRAIKSLLERDDKQARQVADRDNEIDQMEVEIEEDCLKVLALHQPVAIDLRFIVAILKINNDLERIGDLDVPHQKGRDCHQDHRAGHLAQNEQVTGPESSGSSDPVGALEGGQEVRRG